MNFSGQQLLDRCFRSAALTATASLALILLGTACSSTAPTDSNETLDTFGVPDATITVKFVGIDSAHTRGTIRVALWNSSATFMRDGKWLQGRSVPTAEFTSGLAFAPVPSGKYALSAFVDVTDSGQLLRDGFGRPIDPWATSGENAPFMPPTWRHAAVPILAGSNEVVLDFSHREAEE